ncbi:hypothetical protein HN51_035331 [Arachis hypogaea]
MWRENVLEKAKLPAIHDSLPTEAFRHRHRLSELNMCPRCGEETESAMHCLLRCQQAQDIWMNPSILQEIHFSLVLREGNNVTDLIAKLGV